ncbi:unnamed protein product [Nippostrongylus brasiliensis]|uniref:ING domain-containing protein n=1 Tax=Nippostrongylus brasiliensis TaxID=27835 RepID=A0A0N4YAX9_NIPBR|nr:unnamed protein product [Nippostrongylus brasiliensis]
MTEKLKTYMDRLDEEVPVFLQKNSKEIRELDEKDLYGEIDKLSEQKVKLAQNMYDMIDLKINDMDQYFREFNDARVKIPDNQTASDEGSSNDQKESATGQKGGHRKKPLKAASQANSSDAVKPFSAPQIAPVDMPVDPNEPTYCFCHQVSFGQMVACDGPSCKNEWFHFQCVGLTSSPVGFATVFVDLWFRVVQ